VVAGQVPGTPIVSRRKVLQVGIFAGLGAAAAGIGACGLANLYPSEVSGFGGTVTVDPGDVPPPGGKTQIASGRFWLVNLNAEQGGPGLLALWWKCPHLGCTVPWRPTFVFPDPLTGAPKQGWFRCPCHGSTYTDAGVRVFGPAPRSMDTMALSVDANGRVTVDTGSVTNGSPDNADRALRI
jgi:cytochrome b6-f complex iron-sulfur subunit